MLDVRARVSCAVFCICWVCTSSWCTVMAECFVALRPRHPCEVGHDLNQCLLACPDVYLNLDDGWSVKKAFSDALALISSEPSCDLGATRPEDWRHHVGYD